MAAVCGFGDIVQMLMEKDCKVEVRNKEGKTPLDVAATARTKEALGGHHED